MTKFSTKLRTDGQAQLQEVKLQWHGWRSFVFFLVFFLITRSFGKSRLQIFPGPHLLA